MQCLKVNVFPWALMTLGTLTSMTVVHFSVAYLIVFCR